MASIDDARAAKAKLLQQLQGHPLVNGVGITRLQDGYAVKVNLTEPDEQGSVPDEVDGVPVRSETVGPIRKL